MESLCGYGGFFFCFIAVYGIAGVIFQWRVFPDGRLRVSLIINAPARLIP